MDLDQFAERAPVGERPARALFLSNKQGAARQLIEEACRLAGLELRVVGGATAVDDPVEALNWADVVFSIGRGVIEAMACNRNVFVLDLYGAKGYVNHENVERMRMDSYSGLLDSSWPDAETLAAQLLAGYDPALRMRSYVEAEHAPGWWSTSTWTSLPQSLVARGLPVARVGPSAARSPPVAQAMPLATSAWEGPWRPGRS
ncbi:hypothetical protein [Aestuariimicrobium sp. Y1814]|uniref:hypothetical protein n=1 Tax=Aestuariimicrobium sp. Y1814 TaxID=3418742 RepID=UPI003DA71318